MNLQNSENSTNEIKNIFQLYENLQRLTIINNKIFSTKDKQLKMEIESIIRLDDPIEKNNRLGKCLIDILDERDKDMENIVLYHNVLQKIMDVFEKMLTENQ